MRGETHIAYVHAAKNKNSEYDKKCDKKQTYIETYSRKKEEKLRSYVKPVQTASNERVAMKVIR